MGFIFINPYQDNTLTNLYYENYNRTGSNFGYNELLTLYKISSSDGGIQNSRILLKFVYDDNDDGVDLDYYLAKTISYTDLKYTLFMYDYPSSEKYPSSYDIYIYNASQSWDEGSGSTIVDTGYSNWSSASSTSAWTTAGGDYLTTYSGTQHFDIGSEDLEIDVTDLVTEQLASGNDGFILKLGASEETNDIEYYIKNFWARHTHYYDYKPKLRVEYNDAVNDDRGYITLGISGTIYTYNILNGAYTNFRDTTNSSIYSVTVYNNSTTGSATWSGTFTGNFLATGVYYYSASFPDNSLLYNLADSNNENRIMLYDYWTTGSSQVYNGELYAFRKHDFEDVDISNLIIYPHLHADYNDKEYTMVRLYIRKKVYKKYYDSFIEKDERSKYIVKNIKYRIENAETNAEIIDYCDATKLSRDRLSNYFYLNTKGLQRGNIYKIKFKIYKGFEEIEVDENWTFKIL